MAHEELLGGQETPIPPDLANLKNFGFTAVARKLLS
jgi:hypothetical protein